MPRKLGRGKTPTKIQNLLKMAVKDKSQNALAREIGIGVAVVNRYLKGIGEPTSEILKKLADYFGVSVFELRGDDTLIDGMYTKVWIPVAMYLMVLELFEPHLDQLLNDESVIVNKSYIAAVVSMSMLISQWYREFASPDAKEAKEKADIILRKYYDQNWTGEISASCE